MKKNELKAIAEKYGMEIMRNPITREAWGLKLETAENIPELDALAGDPWHFEQVAVTKEYGVFYEVNGTHLYTVYCPTDWFDLWGWVD